MSVISSGPNNQLAVNGTIVAVASWGFQLAAGSTLGYFDVNTTATTTFNNFTPAVGEFVAASGTGTPTTTLTASSVNLISLPSQPVSVTGQITGMITGGFTVSENGVNSSVYGIYSTTYTGSKPYTGEYVKVSGLGSIGASIVAKAIAQANASDVTPSPSPVASPTAVPTIVPTIAPTMAPTVAPTIAPTTAPGGGPQATRFMPSTWGKISAMQIFDDTNNGYVPLGAASADGWRYTSVWGARNNIGTHWLDSNPSLKTGYYNALETDESSTGWGAIGHTLSWWQANHPDWVLYACTSSGAVTTMPAYVPGLASNVPLDVHNPAVVDYQVRLMANYAHQLGYKALSIDEATFWQADAGAGSGSYGCGIYQNGSFVRRYTGVTDPNWAADVVQWVKIAHNILTTDPMISTYGLKLTVNHPANALTANETEFLSNVDADLDETGYIDYGRPVNGSTYAFRLRTDWATYAQQHGVAVLMNANWANVSVGAPQLDYSVATYLMGNQQGESLFASPATGYGTEQWHSQYQANIGAPCGSYYQDSSSPSIYYRRFANAIVVVNGGSGSGTSQVAHLPSGHSYSDLFGRGVSSSIPSNDGYVLMTSNGCN